MGLPSVIRLGETFQQNPLLPAAAQVFFVFIPQVSSLGRITFGDPIGGDISTKSLAACGSSGLFCFYSSAQLAGFG